jgi:diguanylate cyclase (GGDEF)-like protein
MWEQLQAEGTWSGEIWNRRKNGEIYPEWLSISKVEDRNGQVLNYIGLFMDITAIKTADDRIRYLAHHDPLTRLPNRSLFRDRVQQAFSHAKREGSKVGLLYLDLDNFKYVNDSLGHPVGDSLLQQVAERIQACVRESDTVSRLGGDEFAVALPDLKSKSPIEGIGRKILDSVAKPIELDGQVLRVSFSIGASAYPDDGDDFDTLLKNADTALYQAKAEGKNIYRAFTAAMGENTLGRAQMDTELHWALEREQFFLEYQPQFDTQSGRVIGIEALIRWRHPRLGILAPADFIPVAEQSGLIMEIGHWVLREACRQNKVWHQLGHKLPVAVNISVCQFTHGNLTHLVLEALAESGLPTEALVLEVSESALQRNIEATLQAAKTLSEHGIRFALDDHGIGHACLNYLRSFFINRIKIDSSLIRQTPDDGEDASLIATMIQMAADLGIETIAKGVETDTQKQTLMQVGCRQAQGFLLSHPLGKDAMTELLLGQSPATEARG